MSRRRSLLLAALWLPIAAADYLLLGGEEHGAFWWAELRGFFALFGLVACVVLILISKTLGHFCLDRSEDYYDSEDGDRDE